MPNTDIELTITQTADTTITAGLRVELPNRRTDLVVPIAIKIDTATLRSRITSPNDYGAELTKMIFVPALREGWQRARGFVEADESPLRVRLVLQGDDALHAIRWELMHDPIDNSPLAHTERVPFSRFLSSAILTDVQAATWPELRAVVAVANPLALATFGMSPVNVADEVSRAKQGFGDIPTTILDGQADRPAATLAALATALRDGAHILYLVCHGQLKEGQSFLYLEQQEAGERYQPVLGDALIDLIAHLQQRPILIVLASCQGAGDTYAMLAPIGPRLTQAGIGAVIAMQGNVPVELIDQLTPTLFRELRRDGQIDRALAAARAALPATSPWWMPTLWMAVKDGALWREPVEAPQPWWRRRFALVVTLAMLSLALVAILVRPLWSNDVLPYTPPPVRVGIAELVGCDLKVAQELRASLQNLAGATVASQSLGTIADAPAARAQPNLDLVLWGSCPVSAQLTLNAELLGSAGVAELAEPERVQISTIPGDLTRATRLVRALVAYLNTNYKEATPSLLALRQSTKDQDEVAQIAILEGNSRLLAGDQEPAIQTYDMALNSPLLKARALNNRGLAGSGIALSVGNSADYERAPMILAEALSDLENAAATADPAIRARALANQAAAHYLNDLEQLDAAETKCAEVITLRPDQALGYLCRAATRYWQIFAAYSDPSLKCKPTLSTEAARVDLEAAARIIETQPETSASRRRDLATAAFYHAALAQIQMECDKADEQSLKRESDEAFRQYLALASGLPALASDRYQLKLTTSHLKEAATPLSYSYHYIRRHTRIPQ